MIADIGWVLYFYSVTKTKPVFMENNKKNRYSNTSQDKVLKSGYTELQTRKALYKAWIGYKIAKNKGEHERLKYYASGFQKLQREVIDAGIASPQSLSKFPLDFDEK
jgi:hypothetical protein